MFVNVSPADYNAEETINALNYASRVKLVKNSAEKQTHSKVVKEQAETIKRLQAELLSLKGK
eukprot:1315357-Amorphochlora_amoeboformis.AAC.1